MTKTRLKPKQSKNVEQKPSVILITRRQFTTLVGIVAVGGAATVIARRFSSQLGEADLSHRTQGIRVKMPEQPCCSPAYRAVRLDNGSFVVWTTLPGSNGLRAFKLNTSGAEILKLCDGTRRLETIEKIGRAHGFSAGLSISFVQRLDNLGIVVSGGYVNFGDQYPDIKPNDVYTPKFY
jgi:hypothetical protein